MDVIVCDGFIGNVVLKVSEGLADMVKQMLRESFEATLMGKIGYVISKSAFADFKKRRGLFGIWRRAPAGRCAAHALSAMEGRMRMP